MSDDTELDEEPAVCGTNLDAFGEASAIVGDAGRRSSPTGSRDAAVATFKRVCVTCAYGLGVDPAQKMWLFVPLVDLPHRVPHHDRPRADQVSGMLARSSAR